MFKVVLREKENKRNKREYEINVDSPGDAFEWGERQAKELGSNYGIEVFRMKTQ